MRHSVCQLALVTAPANAFYRKENPKEMPEKWKRNGKDMRNVVLGRGAAAPHQESHGDGCYTTLVDVQWKPEAPLEPIRWVAHSGVGLHPLLNIQNHSSTQRECRIVRDGKRSNFGCKHERAGTIAMHYVVGLYRFGAQ